MPQFLIFPCSCALEGAVHYRHTESVSALIAVGTDVNCVDTPRLFFTDYGSLLDMAVASCEGSIIILLIGAGARFTFNVLRLMVNGNNSAVSGGLFRYINANKSVRKGTDFADAVSRGDITAVSAILDTNPAIDWDTLRLMCSCSKEVRDLILEYINTH